MIATTVKRPVYVTADVVEVSPPYDSGDATALAAAASVFDLVSTMALRNK